MITLLRLIDWMLTFSFSRFEANPLFSMIPIGLSFFAVFISIPIDLAILYRKKIQDKIIKKTMIIAWFTLLFFYACILINNMTIIIKFGG